MKALQFKNNQLVLAEVPAYDTPDTEARIKVIYAGICAADIQIVNGYTGFEGTLGHEFIGLVEECDTSPELIGKRVVGEINSSCGYCEMCQKGIPRHCSNRDVLGISGRDGAFADYVYLPAWNLHRVPDEIDDQSAVFVEPLAAACEILEQVHISHASIVLLIGDGKLAHLIARVLSLSMCTVEVVGVNESKIRKMKGYVTKGYLNSQPPGLKYPLVIEVSGSPSGWETAVKAVEPTGTIILKSNYGGVFKFNPAPLVDDEITVVGSRCGSFLPALQALKNGLKVDDLIDSVFELKDWEDAFNRAKEPDSLKVLFKMD